MQEKSCTTWKEAVCTAGNWGPKEVGMKAGELYFGISPTSETKLE